MIVPIWKTQGSRSICGFVEEVTCKVWKTEAFQNATLYLLDTDLPGTSHGWITRQLYASSPQERVAAEMVLGIGGVRFLRKLGFEPDIYHLNEGHAVFAGLELIREKMSRGSNFHHAWEETPTDLFTTPPVMAGNEEHDHGLKHCLGGSRV